MMRKEGAWFGGDFSDSTEGLIVPVISHESGQWCAYPDLAEIKADPVTTAVRCKCGICGGTSYVKTIEGQFYPGAAEDNIAFEVQEPPDGETIVFRAWRH